MTTQIEKEFFEAMEVGTIDCEICLGKIHEDLPCDYMLSPCKYSKNRPYPPITPAIVLELIAILNEALAQGLGVCSLVCGDTKEKIINGILKDCVEYKDHIKQSVQKLFKDGGE